MTAMPNRRARPSRVAQVLVCAPIAAYQRVISPALPRRCKYEPTCSRYAVGAVMRFGVLRGLVLACWRVLRCNPWSHGGYDPVEAQRIFRDRGEAAAATPGPDLRPHVAGGGG